MGWAERWGCVKDIEETSGWKACGWIVQGMSSEDKWEKQYDFVKIGEDAWEKGLARWHIDNCSGFTQVEWGIMRMNQYENCDNFCYVGECV